MPAEINAYDALYIPANDVPWFPYEQSGCDVQLIQADPASGRWMVKLRGPAGGNLGIHRHYGSVLALTVYRIPGVKFKRTRNATKLSNYRHCAYAVERYWTTGIASARAVNCLETGSHSPSYRCQRKSEDGVRG